MTLLPSHDFGIRGHEGKAYDVDPRCAHPSCTDRSAHVHHLWPRSHLRGQPYEWVQLPDGTVIGNRIGLCSIHHDMVTGEIGGYRAMIKFSGGVFYWLKRHMPDSPISWVSLGPLKHQPPGTKHHETTLRPDERDTCPTCGHRKERKRPKLPSRKTKTWTLTVPDDAEIGSDILDEWADEVAAVLGFADKSSRLRRYHAVTTALAWTMQNKDQFMADIVEAQNA